MVLVLIILTVYASSLIVVTNNNTDYKIVVPFEMGVIVSAELIISTILVISTYIIYREKTCAKVCKKNLARNLEKTNKLQLHM